MINRSTSKLCMLSLLAFSQTVLSNPLDEKTLLHKLMGAIAQTAPVRLFNKHIATKVSHYKQLALKYGDEDAAAGYQDLSKEAQSALGIPEEHHIPTKKFDPECIMAKFAGAVAEPDAIYVNEEKLDQREYGDQRTALFHEAVHTKYNDMSMDLLLEFTALCTASYGAHRGIKSTKTPGRFKILHGIAVMLTGLVAADATSTQFGKFIERRADIEGHYATQCSTCVQESADHRRQIFEHDDNLLKNNGYLWAQDLESIAQALDQQQQKCDYHNQPSEAPKGL